MKNKTKLFATYKWIENLKGTFYLVIDEPTARQISINFTKLDAEKL
jgi:hypothetical protein